MNHTSTPWSIRTARAGQSGITGTKYYDHILEPLNALIERNSSEESANARRIVKCVNSHEALVEALQMVIDDYNDNGNGCGLIDEDTLKVVKQALKAESEVVK